MRAAHRADHANIAVSGLSVASTLAPELEKLGIGVVLPDARTLDLRSKIGIASLAPRLGLRAPYSRLARTYDEVFAVAREFLMPFVVKGHYYGAITVQSFDQLAGA